MKETKIFSFDDLAWADGEQRVEAAETATLTLRLSVAGTDERAELDLTDEHVKELVDFLAPYFAAGSPPPPPARKPPPPPTRRSPSSSGRNPSPYNAGMRGYADARGISYRTGAGHVYYSEQLRAEYQQFLEDGGKI